MSHTTYMRRWDQQLFSAMWHGISTRQKKSTGFHERMNIAIASSIYHCHRNALFSGDQGLDGNATHCPTSLNDPLTALSIKPPVLDVYPLPQHQLTSI